jgi:anti-sigma factor RsiW
MSARIDGDLDEASRQRFDRHIAGCRRCARVLASLRSTLDELHGLRDAPTPMRRSVVEDVLGRIDDPPRPGSGDVR